MRPMEQYFDLIHRHTPESAVMGLTTITAGYVNTRWYRRGFFDKLYTDITGTNRRSNVFARITPLSKPPDYGRGTERQALGASALYLDFDSYGSQLDGVRALEAFQLPPTMIVNSGNGLHGYWLLDRFYTDQEALKARTKHLALVDFGGKEDGGDSCYDLARVLRVPETFNNKTADPIECTIVSINPDRIYRLEQFAAMDLAEDQPIDIWDSEPLAADFIEALRDKDPKLVKRIISEDGARKADAPMNGDGRVDRSRNDAFIATRLLSLGYSAGTALTVLSAPEWFAGAKYHERKRYDYVIATVNKAVRNFSTSADQYFVKSTFVADRLAEELSTAANYIYAGERLWRYVNGVFIGDGEDYVKAQVVKRLAKRWSSRASDETIRYLVDQSRIPVDRVNRHEGLINCANGMIDSSSGELLAHDPKYLSTVQVPAVFDPAADTTAIDQFIAAILPADAIAAFWQYVGSAFLTDRYEPKAFIALVGPPNTGKSQVLKLLINFFGGATNVSALSLQTLADNKFATSELFGRVANIFSDLDESEAQNVGQIKALTGGDKISGEQKFKGFFMFANAARLFFSSNSYPAVRAPDDAYFIRAKIIPCRNVFDATTADRYIVDKLSTPANLSALLLRAVEGLRQLISNNYELEHSPSIEAANADYQFSADTIVGFLHNCEIVADFFIPKQRFYQIYRSVCKAANRKEVSQDKFFKRVADYMARFGMTETYKLMPDGSRQWVYYGRKPAQADGIMVIPSMLEMN